jgi:hypothetical protein
MRVHVSVVATSAVISREVWQFRKGWELRKRGRFGNNGIAGDSQETVAFRKGRERPVWVFNGDVRVLNCSSQGAAGIDDKGELR